MTTEIEKQFFDTFGIEPEYQDRCTVEDKYWDNEELANEYGTFDQYMNCKCGNQENCTTECSCAYQKEIYPTITDRILLELICILTRWHLDEREPYEIISINIKQLKNQILSNSLYIAKYAKAKHQVRALFKEVK